MEGKGRRDGKYRGEGRMRGTNPAPAGEKEWKRVQRRRKEKEGEMEKIEEKGG
jgi:hypothetical protein